MDVGSIAVTGYGHEQTANEPARLDSTLTSSSRSTSRRSSRCSCRFRRNRLRHAHGVLPRRPRTCLLSSAARQFPTGAGREHAVIAICTATSCTRRGEPPVRSAPSRGAGPNEGDLCDYPFGDGGDKIQGERSRGAPILVVDDAATIRVALAEILRQEGFTVVEACHGREALDYLLAGPILPRLILLDLSMPVMSGWELLGVLRAYRRFADLPIILVTGERPTTDPANLSKWVQPSISRYRSPISGVALACMSLAECSPIQHVEGDGPSQTNMG